MLSEISSDRERKMLYDFTDMCNPKIKQMSKQNKTNSHRYREQTGGFQWRGGCGETRKR